MIDYSFFSQPLKEYCPLVLGDIVRIIDCNDKSVPVYYGDGKYLYPVSIPEVIALHIDKSVKALYKMRALSLFPDLEKIKCYPSITNYMCGVLHVLVFLGFIEDYQASDVMKYLVSDFKHILLKGKYYSADPSRFSSDFTIYKFED